MKIGGKVIPQKDTPTLYFLISAIGNCNMVDARTFEVKPRRLTFNLKVLK
jgi:hypothetical protein